MIRCTTAHESEQNLKVVAEDDDAADDDETTPEAFLVYGSRLLSRPQ